MATNTTRWTPDTCPSPGCTVEYTWDDAVPAVNRVHTFSRVVGTCTAHGTATGSALYTILLNENTRKNKAVVTTVAALPAVFPSDPTVTWAYDDKRNLSIVTGTAATALQQSTIQTALNTALGSGAVTVVSTATAVIGGNVKLG